MSKPFTFDSDRQVENLTQAEDVHPFKGVSITDRTGWGDDITIYCKEEYVSRRSFNPAELYDGQVVQLFINRIPKQYAYMVNRVERRENHVEYIFVPCYSRSKRAYAYSKNHRLTYMHGDESVKSFQIFSLSDAYILDCLGYPEIVVSTRI